MPNSISLPPVLYILCHSDEVESAVEDRAKSRFDYKAFEVVLIRPRWVTNLLGDERKYRDGIDRYMVDHGAWEDPKFCATIDLLHRALDFPSISLNEAPLIEFDTQSEMVSNVGAGQGQNQQLITGARYMVRHNTSINIEQGHPRVVRIHQQPWCNEDGSIEWRDVPTVDEEGNPIP